MLSLQLIHETIPHKKFIPQTIDFQIKEKGDKKWITDSQYTISGASDILPDSYGFPLITQSQGEKYLVSLSEKIPNSSEYVVLHNEKNSIAGIFFLDKKALIKNPQQLFFFLVNKLQTVAANTEAQEVFLLSFPFILFTLYLFITNKLKTKLNTIQ